MQQKKILNSDATSLCALMTKKEMERESEYHPICDQVIQEEMTVPSPTKLYNKREISIIFQQDNMNSRHMVLDLL